METNLPPISGPRHFDPPHGPTRNVLLFAGGLTDEDLPGGWLLYDAACPFCTRIACQCGPFLRRAQIGALPLQTQWVQSLLAQRRQPLLKEIRFLDPRGRLSAGADALVNVARRIWWLRPFAWMTRVPGALPLLRKGYAFFAARRHQSLRKRGLFKTLLVPWKRSSR